MIKLCQTNKSSWLVYCCICTYLCVPGPPGCWNVVVPGSSPSLAQSLSSWTLLIGWTAATPPCCPLWWRTPPSRTTRSLTPSGVQHLKPFVCSHYYLSLYRDLWKDLLYFDFVLLFQAWTMTWTPKVSCDPSPWTTGLCLNHCCTLSEYTLLFKHLQNYVFTKNKNIS